ncbi:MAG: glycosyltransferase [Victivallaceae bacterium]|nr:glycosyltransferase [Victivallaceae bacterium]
MENPDVTERLRKIFPGKPVETVWNCYNQVFDHPETQKEHPLPKFRGTTLLTVSAFYPHKNFPVLVGAAEYLATHHPDSDFRFVLTLTPDAFPVPEKLKRHFIFTGKVKIEECPSLYRQADLMILPTLLECFSASWAEAMKTGVPILTSDLPFARGICGGAAVYFDPLSPEDVAGKIFDLSGDPARRAVLAERGKERLRLFDTPETRTEKYIALVKSIAESVRAKKATG